jgi:hypothetical protein
MTENQCTGFGGDWYSDIDTCDPNPCPPPPVAACCVGTDCVLVNENECGILGGEWHPEWVECLPSICHEEGPPCPPAWLDRFEETTAAFLFEVPGIYERRPIIATGPTVVLRDPAEFLRDGNCLIETEILELDLVGVYDPATDLRDHDSISVVITLDTLATYGTIVSSDDGFGNPDYPDTSSFHVNVLITFDDRATFPHTIDVSNLLTRSDLWGDPPCVDPEGPYVSPSNEHAHFPCPTIGPEGACELPPEIGGGCFITREVICGSIRGYYYGHGTNCSVTGIEETDLSRLPLALELLQNPSTSSLSIRFQVPREGVVNLDVYDSSGRRVRSLLSEAIPPGQHTIDWDALTADGHDLAPGIYYILLRGESGQVARKAVILK